MFPDHIRTFRDILRQVEKGELSGEEALQRAQKLFHEGVEDVIAHIKNKAITSEEGVCDLHALLG